MSELERGAYTPPTDAPLSFDARQPVRGARPIPFTLIISILVLGALVAAILIFYRSGVRQAGEPPRTVGEAVGGLKVAPPAEAQPEDPAAGLEIYRAEAGQPPEAAGQPKFAPPPEQPQPRTAAPAVVVTPPPAAAPSGTVTAGPALRPALPAASAIATPAPKTQPAAPAPVKTAAALPPKPAPVPVVAVKPAPATPAPISGGAVVQIGAVSSTALADQAWNAAVAVAPGMAAGKGKSVQKIEKNGGTLYRTAVTGFTSREAATAFCGKLKAAGKSCFVR
jgi:hypothetical protein